MVERILTYERDLFLALNGSDSAFLDRFMWLYTGKFIWLPLIVFILVVLIYKKNWRESVLVLLAIGLVVLLCDQFTSHLCKPYFMRFRPTHHPDFMEHVKVVFDYRGGLYGFISGHAANSFGVALLLSCIMKNKLFTWTVFLWAVLMSYTRIYLGVHFISDIVPGAISGLIFGYIVYLAYRYARGRLVPGVDLSKSPYSVMRGNLIVYGIWVMTLIIIVFNVPLVSCFLK